MKPDVLVKKLLDLNVPPYLIRVVKSFFVHRLQCVKYQNLCSVYRCCHIGVPQGTILGPLLWNAFVYDLKPAISHIKYANDTTIYNVVNKSHATVTDSTTQKNNHHTLRKSVATVG